MNRSFLIPANSKRSMLILSLFTPIDLIIIGVGGGLTLILLLIISAQTLTDVLVILIPILVAATMVMPVPNHHNVWTLTANIYNFLSKRRTYYWKGWCMIYGKEDETSK